MNEQSRLSPDLDADPAPFTALDYLRMIEIGAFDAMRVELVRGELRKMHPAYFGHGERNASVGARLYDIVVGTRMHIAIDLMIQIDDTTILAADVAMVGDDTPRDAPARASDVVLVVEISGTTLRRDLGEKRYEYASAAIGHYWVVDIDQRVTHVFADPRDGDYREVRRIAFTDAIPVPGTDRSITID